MKFYKFFLGILLFIAPITLHTYSGGFVATTPIGTAENLSALDEFSFAFHSFQMYSEDGRINYMSLITSDSQIYALAYYLDLPNDLSVAGLLTLITLIAVAVYLILAIIDNKILNLVGDIILLGCCVMSIFAFLDYHNGLFGYEFGIPIFPILSGILALVGLTFSILKLAKK